MYENAWLGPRGRVRRHERGGRRHRDPAPNPTCGLYRTCRPGRTRIAEPTSSRPRSIIGNIVGTYNELAELMVLTQAGKVTLHTKAYPLDAAQDALRDLDAAWVHGRAILVP